jgi:UrcA family protein
MKKLALTALAATAAAFAFAAPAAAQDDLARERVDVSDLDPGRDASEIERRIAHAARRVCGAPDSRTVTAIARVETCRAAASQSARR